MIDQQQKGGVIEGISDSIRDGVELTFVGAKVNWPACNSVGAIVASGPRLPDDGSKGGSRLRMLADGHCGRSTPLPRAEFSLTADRHRQLLVAEQMMSLC